MVTANKKYTIDSQKLERKEIKPITKENHQKTKGKKKKEWTEKNYKNNLETRIKMTISTYWSIISLNVNGLNAPIKRHKAAYWIRKQEPTVCCLKETHFRVKDTQTETEGMEKIFHVNGNDKKARVAIFISDKIEFNAKAIKKTKKGII